MPQERTWLFVAEWFDPMPMLKRKYLLKYFIETNSVEMVDLKSRKLFLKKSDAGPRVKQTDFFIGGRVVVYGRELDIVDYGDGATRSELGNDFEAAAAVLPAAGSLHWGTTIDRLIAAGLVIRRVRTLIMETPLVQSVASVLPDADPSLLVGRVNLLLVMHGPDGIQTMRKVLEGLVKELDVPPALLARSEADVEFLTKSLGSLPATATFDSCTCVVIKPHAMKSGATGKIVDQILKQGYELSAMETLQFDKAQAAEFLEVYRDVVPDYAEHVVEICSGLTVALELRAQDAVQTFRQTAGPWDVQMAKVLRPTSLRALFGADNVRCAVQCTDLPPDGPLDCEYCFSVMQA